MSELIGVHVPRVDTEARRRARERADALLMPRRALGRLLDIGEIVAGISGFPTPSLSRKAIAVMAGDHGVTEEGVSAYPADVTGQMVHGFTAGMAGINVLSRHAGITVKVVDMGCRADLSSLAASGKIIDAKVAPGTRNMMREPAMSREQALESLRRGAQIARDLAKDGIRMVGTGDMGIGNTTPSAAIAAVVTGKDVASLTGRGTGIDDATLARKVRVIEQSISARRPDPQDGVDILTKIGGFEIGGIAGFVLGAAECRLPVVIDGVISTAGALLAWLMEPRIVDYLFAAHRSVEPAHTAMLETLGLSPLLDLGLRLGEGTGCALAMPIIEAGVKVIADMATFQEAGVSTGA
ncbi:MAG TPA: nicotinate-nucleotide--dimethylbenzimidazole phosphoribosyltransferase [Spirochaetia bacterium]|nr:nicotinate-nucleotide--dimethylbenzimidazole phosphoribosyltransferase [Spirochaetia bacterium]